MENFSDHDVNPSDPDDASLFMEGVIGEDFDLLRIDLLLREALGNEP